MRAAARGEDGLMQGPPQGPPRLSREEFARLVDRHQQRLHAYLAGLVGHEEQAFDLVQETFYDAWRAAQKGTPPFLAGADEADVRRWLYRVAFNNAISALRRSRRIRWESLEGVEEESLGVEDPFEDRVAEGEALQAALAQLSPHDVACLLLRVVHGFSSGEVGLILDTSADNVNNRLARAKRRLRAAYARERQDRRKAGARP
jgi:RNA polymerase sigma-70 factor (ECF subfamily)